MPTILREQGFRFHFFSEEHLPIHIHIKKGGARARIVLEPSITIDKNDGFNPPEMRKIVKIIEQQYDYLIQQWHETFGK